MFLRMRRSRKQFHIQGRILIVSYYHFCTFFHSGLQLPTYVNEIVRPEFQVLPSSFRQTWLKHD